MLRKLHGLFSCLPVLVVLAAGGCGKGAYPSAPHQTVPAGGVVTYNGGPVAGATVLFAPQDSGKPSASAVTDAQGRFRLQTYGVNDGAVPGDYTVSVMLVEITPPEGNPDDPDYDPTNVPPPPPPKWLVPEKFSNPRTSGLQETVAADGKNEFTFKLED